MELSLQEPVDMYYLKCILPQNCIMHRMGIQPHNLSKIIYNLCNIRKIKDKIY